MKTMCSRFFASKLIIGNPFVALLFSCLVSTTLFANEWTPVWNVNAKLTSTSTGRGSVYVGTSSSVSNTTEWKTDGTWTIKGSKQGETSFSASKTFYLHAKSEPGYYFSGWFEDENGSKLLSSDNPAKQDLEVTRGIDVISGEVKGTWTYYAVFGDLSDVSVTMKKGEESSKYTVKTSGTQRTYTIEGQDVIFDYDNGNGEFLQGSDLKVVLTNKTCPEGSRFYAWRIEENGTTTDYRTSSLTYTFTSIATVTPIYVPEKYAMYAVGNNYLTLYADLQEAIDLAQKTTPSVVTVMNDGELDIREKNSYTIPSGVTLLVPGEGTYCCRVGGITEYDIRGTSTFKKFVEFTLPSNAQLNVEGGLSVYAYLATTTLNPGGYGQIDLSEGAQINIKSGGVATIYGFITGDHTKSKVVVEKGGTIYETLRMLDWRGGQITSSMRNDSHKVFPVNQFYIQNVETTLELQNGAIENVSIATTISTITFVANVAFIVPRDGDPNQTGFLQLGSKSSVRRYLNKSKDKTIFVVSSEGSTMTEEEETILGNIYLNLGSSANIDSKDYVLPIPSHMGVEITDNTKLRIKYPALLLAGSYVYVDFSSSMYMSDNAYLVVYDNEQHEAYLDKKLSDAIDVGWYNYFGSTNQALCVNTLQPARPYKREIVWNKNPKTVYSWGDLQPNKRDEGSLDISTAISTDYGSFIMREDAQLIIDGYVEGEIYTTEGGATITSNGGGKIKLINQTTTRESYQVIQNSNEGKAFVSIPLSGNTMLRNENKEYVDAQGNKTYIFYKPNDDVSGVWKEPEVGLTAIQNNNFDIFIPQSYSQIVQCKVETEVEGFSNFSFSVKLKEGTFFEYDINQIEFTENSIVKIPFTYNPQSYQHGREYSENVTLVISFDNVDGEASEVEREITLTAKENYTPKFSLKIGETTYEMQDGEEGEDGVYDFVDFVFGSDQTGIPVSIISSEGNIASSNFVTWSKSVESPFEFDSEKNEIIFNPDAAGDFEKVFTCKATYDNGTPTDDTDDIFSDIKVRLKAKAILQENSFKLKINNVSLFKGNVLTLSKEDLFDDMGNNTSIEISNDYNSYLTIDEQGDSYILTGLDEIDAATVLFKQEATSVMEAKTCTLTVEVKPEVKFNWRYLYYNSTVEDPIDTENSDWTLSVINPETCPSLVVLNKVDGVYQAIVSAPENLEDDCVVSFVYEQGGNSLEFGPIPVFEDPKILPFCLEDGIDAQRVYEAVTISNETKNVELVTIEGDNNDYIEWTNVDENNHPQWTIQFLGVADKLSLQLLEGGRTGEWIIEDITKSTPVTLFAESLKDNILELPLYIDTEKLRITYYTETQGEQVKMKDICISKLQISANTEKINLPIELQDNGTQIESKRFVTIVYSADKVGSDVKIVNSNKQPISSITVDYQTLPDQPGKRVIEQQITITNESCQEEGDYYLMVGNELEIPIRTYFYPMVLPIISNDWVDERENYFYYYLFDNPNNVTWESPNILLKPTLGNGNRYVTFAFKGGAHTMSFDVLSEITMDEWLRYWNVEQSVDGEDWLPVTSDENTPNITFDANNTRSTIELPILKYTSKYIRIVNNEEVSLSINNLRIEGIPAVDVNIPFEGHYVEAGVIDRGGVMNFTPNQLTLPVEVMAINLTKLEIELEDPDMFKLEYDGEDKGSGFVLDDSHSAIGKYTVGQVPLQVTWKEKSNIDESKINFYDVDATGNKKLLSTISLLGAADIITIGNATETGVYTGIPKDITHPFQDLEDKYKYKHREVDLSHTFDGEGYALFDYLVVYGETTADKGNEIKEPTPSMGSNAKTPYSIYKKVEDKQYQLVHYAFNANQGEKEALHSIVDAIGNKLIPHAEETEGTRYINIAGGEQLRVYMTGFCPYASTGFDKDQEGVWLFRAKKNAKLDVYLEDCHIYSRNKTRDGHTFTGKFDEKADYFQDFYAKGSGGVLVFECNQEGEYTDKEAFQVTIHTRGNNLLKSNHGCFFQIMGARAYQVSSPLQIRMTSDQLYVENSKTHLTLDDKWLTDATDITKFTRTNGFISLQKQANNAPSIDMGNGNTVVNFRGGQVELQNAQNVSDKYKTTLAISYRSGIMAAGGVEIQMAVGLGTDAATEGTVNFYDGTITVIPMKVDVKDRKYYLMDEDDPNTPENEAEYTSCLRCPEHTYVYGGSICMLRTCMSPISKGGAPTDGNEPLGRFFYTANEGFTYHECDAETEKNNPGLCKLVTLNEFPHNTELFGNLSAYYSTSGYEEYGTKSLTPNEKDQVILWLPKSSGKVEVEEDRLMTTWKACMPEITATLGTVGTTIVGGTVGGLTGVENIEDVENLLYCQLDDNIYDVISDTEGEGDDEYYVYEAPLKVPEGFQMDGVDLGLGDYMRLAPSYVGGKNEHQMTNEEDYNINSKVYYVTSATADNWMTFTAPFNVGKIWVVETYDETALSRIDVDENDEQGTTKRGKILKTQATHNADFASFFGVAMALGSEKTFEQIYDEYMAWAMIEDKHQGEVKYTKRGMYPLIPYTSGNWDEANFYLYHNKGNWTIKNANNGEFEPQWNYVEKQGDVLLQKGETYSMLFPYCVGCDEEGEGREYWDYWTGKFIIFESTQATKENPHVIRGSNYVGAEAPKTGEWVFPSAEVSLSSAEAIVTGNSTFTHMNTSRSDVFVYDPYREVTTADGKKTIIRETFMPIRREEMILPTTAFLVANPPVSATGARALSISRMGRINYGSDNNNDDDTPTGGEHVPTINGGSDLFVTSVAEGINIAVGEPQYVGVFSATGQLIYSGWVETSVDVNLVVDGVYVVVGENTSLKVLY